MPVGVKDNIAVAGMPMRFGSRLTGTDPVAFDAPAVARLKEQGAIVLGKTAMPEYGWKATSDSPLTGLTRNPWDTRMTTGGSSAGAVAATVLGMGTLHLGTDGGGSIRIPAAFTGCFGLKPTRARVPAFPTSPLGTMAHHGPLTRTVADAALAMSVIAAPDARDVYGWISPAPDFRAGLDGGVRGLRIAYSPKLGFARRVHPEVERAVAAAAKMFERLGAIVEETDPDIGGDPIGTWNTFWWPAMLYQLTAFGDRARDLADPALLEAAAQSHAVTVIRSNPCAAHRAHCTTCSCASTRLRPAAHAIPAASGIRSRGPGTPLRRLGHGVVRLGALQLSLQPHHPARRFRARAASPTPACQSGCRSSGRSAPTPWCCAPRALSKQSLHLPRSIRRAAGKPSGQANGLEQRLRACEHECKLATREDTLAQEIRIEFTRFSAFYSPLIATMAGGFLKAEGLEGKHSVSSPGKTAIASLLDGTAHVVQSAPSQGFTPLEQGKTSPTLHFAQINEKDGFFLTGRSPDPAFTWDKLKGKRVLIDHGGQPMAMFKYACFKRGLDFSAIEAVDAGSTDKMIAAFRGGQGTLFTCKARRRSSSSMTRSATSWLHLLTPSAPARSPASPRPANGSRPIWQAPSCAPIANRALG